MLYSSWSIALLICSAAVLFLNGVATRTAIRVLRLWDGDADTPGQIELERETWLAAMLMRYGMVLQLCSLVLLVLAAEDFSRLLAGAMCATGTFWANGFGPPLLAVRCLAVFTGGFWLLVNHLDHSSEFRPLLRRKYILSLVQMPLLVADAALLILFLARLEPDVITSCCGVIFGSSTGAIGFALLPISPGAVAVTFYCVFTALLLAGMLQLRNSADQASYVRLYSLFCLLFFLLSLIAVTLFFSPYIYATPAHRCPFDILQNHYNYIGYPLYFLLFSGSFFGMSLWPVVLMSGLAGAGTAAATLRRRALGYSLFALCLFVLIVTWYPAVYLFAGGER